MSFGMPFIKKSHRDDTLRVSRVLGYDKLGQSLGIKFVSEKRKMMI